ncbi:MAG: 16S rRNA (guanine(527)-N(7))-methyltransferase RsmG [Cardiobacteriaceae bacterium]|nr:16S rRNA (guanine(527)-N(7))-methyltransferase RsmG [Cardiobacteriaceae bacterium]
MLPDRAQEKLLSGLEALSFNVSPEQYAQFVAYIALLNKWNQVHNLTAIRDPEEQVVRHVLDCLVVVPFLTTVQTLIDVGSGAGLPALMLAIMRPDLQVMALESNGKKAGFIRQAIRELGLSRVDVAACRVENWHEKTYDVIISRALASATLFLSMTAHLGDKNSRWLLMKGKETEVVQVAGFTLSATYPLQVPHLNAARMLLEMRREQA